MPKVQSVNSVEQIMRHITHIRLRLKLWKCLYFDDDTFTQLQNSMVDVWSPSIKCEKWGLKREFENDISSLTRLFPRSQICTNAMFFFGCFHFLSIQTKQEAKWKG